MPSPLYPRPGYTLIELLTAVVILGIIASLAAPSVMGTLGRAERQAALSRIAGDLYLARMQAVRRGERVMIRFDSTANAEFSGNYQVVTDVSAKVLKQVDLGLEPGELRMGNRRQALVFNSRGLLVGASNRKIWIEQSESGDSLVISRLGRVYRTF